MTSQDISAAKILPWEDVHKITEGAKASNKKVVHCHGVFDLLHPGHVQHFLAAKKMGDILIVSITADKHVNKGPGRPLFDELIRAETIASIEAVDYVFVSDYPTAIEAIKEVKPHFYVKGSDYQIASDDVTGMIVLEKETVESFGGPQSYHRSGVDYL